MIGHAVADAWKLQQFLAIGGQFFDGFVQAVEELRGFFVAAKPANHCAVDFKQLRSFPQNARDFAVVHVCGPALLTQDISEHQRSDDRSVRLNDESRRSRLQLTPRDFFIRHGAAI